MSDDIDENKKIRLTDEELAKIADKVLTEISKHGLISSERHWLEHEWIKAQIEKTESIKSRRERIVDKIVGGVGLVLILGLVTWLGQAIMAQAAVVLKKLVN